MIRPTAPVYTAPRFGSWFKIQAQRAQQSFEFENPNNLDIFVGAFHRIRIQPQFQRMWVPDAFDDQFQRYIVRNSNQALHAEPLNAAEVAHAESHPRLLIELDSEAGS